MSNTASDTPDPRPAAERLQGALVVLRPATTDDIPALRAIRATPEVRARWRDEEDTAESIADKGLAFLAIVVNEAVVVNETIVINETAAGREAARERVVGAIQWSAEDDPDYAHAGIDIYLDPAVHGRGIGTDSVRTLARHLIDDLGFHRLVIDPAADNAPAIRCYAKVGFKPVGVMRRYERDTTGDGWHDGLLMDLMAEELVRQ